MANISIISRAHVNNARRIEAEFYQPYYLSLEGILLSNKTLCMFQFADVTDGEHGSPKIDESSGIKYLSGNNICDNYIDYENAKQCTLELHKRNIRSALLKGNVLLSIVGSIGNASAVIDDVLGNTDRNVATIKNINNNRILPNYLSVFLNTKFGKYQTNRLSTGNNQPFLNLINVKSLIVPELDILFQKLISDKYLLFYKLLNKSKLSYTKAIEILLKSIGIYNWQPNLPKYFTKYLTNISSSLRFDAELRIPTHSATQI